MIIKAKEEDNVTIISFSKLRNGQLDLSNTEGLKKAFNKITTADSRKNVILNFQDIQYIDSSIIGCIVDLFNDIRNKGGALKLVNVSKNIFEILEMTNLSRFLDISRDTGKIS